MPHIHRGRLVAVPAALALVAVVAVAAVALRGDDDDGETVASCTTTTTEAAATAAGPASGTGPAVAAITWTGTSRIADPGAGCEVTSIYTMTIEDGARFAGAPAVVLRYGPDYPDRPTETFTVGPEGTFEVPFEARTCAEPGTAGVALVSVDGNTDVQPPPPA